MRQAPARLGIGCASPAVQPSSGVIDCGHTSCALVGFHRHERGTYRMSGMWPLACPRPEATFPLFS